MATVMPEPRRLAGPSQWVAIPRLAVEATRTHDPRAKEQRKKLPRHHVNVTSRAGGARVSARAPSAGAEQGEGLHASAEAFEAQFAHCLGGHEVLDGSQHPLGD